MFQYAFMQASMNFSRQRKICQHSFIQMGFITSILGLLVFQQAVSYMANIMSTTQLLHSFIGTIIAVDYLIWNKELEKSRSGDVLPQLHLMLVGGAYQEVERMFMTFHFLLYTIFHIQHQVLNDHVETNYRLPARSLVT